MVYVWLTWVWGGFRVGLTWACWLSGFVNPAGRGWHGFTGPGTMGDRCYFVYLLASGRNGTLYCGVTNDLLRRVSEHRAGRAEGFTRKHGVTRLMWFEEHSEIAEAILREKRIKRWNRAWKVALIEERNPQWVDLGAGLGLGRWEGFAR